jgi:hypothetical protein
MESLTKDFDVERESVGNWSGKLSGNWQVGKIPSGGYSTYVVLKCIVGELKAASTEPPPSGQKRPPNAHSEVLSANVHFLNRMVPGHFQTRVSVLKSGKSTSTVAASLFQNNRKCLHVVATCAEVQISVEKGPNLADLSNRSTPPVLPPLAECVRLDAGDNNQQSVRSRVRMRVPLETAQRYQDCRTTRDDGTYNEEMLVKRQKAVKNGIAKYSGYCFFEDGSEPSLAAAPLYLDASIPPILGAYVTGWVPTINWTIQFRQRPAPGPLKFSFETTGIFGGYLEEDGRIWDSNGALVAMSRQIAMVGVSQSQNNNSIHQSSKLAAL